MNKITITDFNGISRELSDYELEFYNDLMSTNILTDKEAKQLIEVGGVHVNKSAIENADLSGLDDMEIPRYKAIELCKVLKGKYPKHAQICNGAMSCLLANLSTLEFTEAEIIEGIAKMETYTPELCELDEIPALLTNAIISINRLK